MKNKNKISNSLKRIEKEQPKQSIKKDIQSAAGGSNKRETEDIQKDQKHQEKQAELENRRVEENIKDIQAARKERYKYASWAFYFMCTFSIVVIAFVVGSSLCPNFLQPIHPAPLTALIGTIPTSMALFGWVLKGLFPTNKE